MGKEGGLSAFCHLLLAAATLYHVVCDPFGLGTCIFLVFGFSQLCVKIIKHACKHFALAFGYGGPAAFWRRPPNSPRPPDSPGFPSSHTSNCASISLFIALETGRSPMWAVALTFAMAMGRMRDNSHTWPQTIAGVMIGPLLGAGAHLIAMQLQFGHLPETGSPYQAQWKCMCVATLFTGFAFFLGDTIPVWMDTLRKYLPHQSGNKST